MDLSAINEIARGGSLPTKKLSDVEHDHSFMVIPLRRVKTKYGPKYVANLEDKFQIFLPSRVCSALEKDEDMFNNMAEAANKLKLFVTCKNSGVEFNIV